MCKPRNKGKGKKSQNEKAESEDSERDGNKRMHGSFLQSYSVNGLERHFLRKHLADWVNHLPSAFHLQAVVNDSGKRIFNLEPSGCAFFAAPLERTVRHGLWLKGMSGGTWPGDFPAHFC
jgi:hypothetical protein